MANVTLHYSKSCGACQVANELWKGLRVKHSFSYREVDILSPDGQELVDRHAVRATPATIIDGKLKFIGVPSRDGAEKALRVRPPERQELALVTIPLLSRASPRCAPCRVPRRRTAR